MHLAEKSDRFVIVDRDTVRSGESSPELINLLLIWWPGVEGEAWFSDSETKEGFKELHTA